MASPMPMPEPPDTPDMPDWMRELFHPKKEKELEEA